MIVHLHRGNTKEKVGFNSNKGDLNQNKTSSILWGLGNNEMYKGEMVENILSYDIVSSSPEFRSEGDYFLYHSPVKKRKSQWLSIFPQTKSKLRL